MSKRKPKTREAELRGLIREEIERVGARSPLRPTVWHFHPSGSTQSILGDNPYPASIDQQKPRGP